MRGRSAVVRRLTIAVALTAAVLATAIGIVAASNTVSGLTESRGDVSVPTWLYLATGGGVIGASALLSALVTDRDVLDGFHETLVGWSAARARRAVGLVAGTVGFGALLAVIVVGAIGPRTGNANLAVLGAFVGVRAGLTMVAYAIGNPWPALNPWRRVASALPNGFRPYPERLGVWPAVVGVLGLAWLEVVVPLSASPGTLAAVAAAYSIATIAGAVVFSPAAWFRHVDPISVAFRLYGAVAPLQRTGDGLEVRFPGARLADADLATDRSIVGFAIALVWELTYSGFIVTPYSARFVEGAVGVGLPGSIVYLAMLAAGYVAFLWAYWVAAGRTRERAETYLSRRYLAVRFAPPLFAIAAGYHAAHYLGFVISLWPSLRDAVLSPLAPPANPTQLVLPAWFSYVEIGAVLLGHLLAVWVAHSISFELFPGKLQAIRSQYPFVLVMIAFTMVSLWLLSLPTVPPPYAAG